LNYYDDLGVDPDASPEEIRDAYRTLVRLLHPDQQTDPALKRAAEGQMRRINRSYEVLCEPEGRRRYDAERSPPPQRPGPIAIRPSAGVVVRTRIQTGTLVWMLATLASVGLICWLSVQGQPRAARLQPGPVRAAPNPQVVAHVEPLPVPSGHPSIPVQAEEPVLTPVPQIVPMAPPVGEPLHVTAPALPVPAEMPAKIAPKRFGGYWAYVRDKNFPRDAGRYPPQFIEASIEERDGSIHGKYKARYYVFDRPISPNVNFEFEGKPDGNSAKLPWRGEGGSQGQLEINLISANEMEMIWHATDLGESLGLVSGTAILMRRPE
jgi:DnaJ domain